MRMGVREVANLVFKPLTSVDIGNQHFDAGQPVLYIDTAKTSNIEGAASTVYATGGRGNPRLIGWDGEKTLTLTVEDALISPESFAMLSGAGIVKGKGTATDTEGKKVYVHTVYDLVSEEIDGSIYAVLPADVRDGATIVATKEAPIYATSLDEAGAPKYFLSAISLDELVTVNATHTSTGAVETTSRGVLQVPQNAILGFKIDDAGVNNYDPGIEPDEVVSGETIRIDCYTVHGKGAQELEIDAESFAGYYYIEADTLFREEATGQDLPAQFIIPRGKIQSNFTFTMANSGDPSTFTFTIDCFPAYTKFNKSKKVLATLQILDPTDAKHNYADKTVVGHEGRTSDHDTYFDGLYGKNSVFTQIEGQEGGTSEGDQAAIDAVNAMPVGTAEQKLAALQEYNKLTPEQQAKVSPVIKAAIGVANSDETAVAEVINLVNALNDTSTQAEIVAALKAYAKLTDKQEATALASFTAEAKDILGLN